MKKEKVIVASNEKVALDIYKIVLETSISKIAKAGQFIDINIGDKAHLLRRPISISEVNGKFLTLYYKVVGFGTNKMSLLKKGEMLEILGPLGNGFPLVSKKSVLIIGGGIGIAPLLELAKNLSFENTITIVLGYQSKNQIYLEKELKKYGKVIITTDDGSSGFKGNPLDYIKKNNIDFETVYACGPLVMLKALDKTYKDKKQGFLSFEARMGCGVGICYGCAIKTTKGNVRVCHEGPVFELGEVIYES
ncbi:MAG: dihydroorotate dehydrogenase electron transfer subunit [Bacilli bacterium]|jgi:dihydroorotate dehydrogenase electron transfer subunit